MDREKAAAGKIYRVNGIKFIAESTNLGCTGCVLEHCEKGALLIEHDNGVDIFCCSDFPICSDVDLSVIFVRTEK